MENITMKKNQYILEQAEHQFTGYTHWSRGYKLLDLCENMWLKKEERDQIKINDVHMLREEEIEEIDLYFESNTCTTQ